MGKTSFDYSVPFFLKNIFCGRFNFLCDWENLINIQVKKDLDKYLHSISEYTYKSRNVNFHFTKGNVCL